MKRSTTALATVLALTGISAHSAELRMSWWGGDSRHVATQAALEVCGAKTGHSIKPEFTGWGGHLEKVTTQLAGGTEADIMQLNWPWLPIFSPDGTNLVDLNTLSDTIDLSNWNEAAIAQATLGGKLNGLAASQTGMIYWFNQDIYEQAGLALPTSIDDLVTAAAVFEDKLGEGYFPFYLVGEDVVKWLQNVVAQSTGKGLIDDSTMTVAYTQDELVAGIEMYQMLVDAKVTPSWPDAAAAGNVQLYENPSWADGHYAGTYVWDSTYFKYAEPLTVGTLVPSGLLSVEGGSNDGVYRKASMVFSLSKNSDNLEAAAQVLNCLLNEPEGITAMGTARGLPASKAAQAQLAADGSIVDIQTEANDMVLQASGPEVSAYAEHPEVRSLMTDTLELFAYGELSAQEAAEEIILGTNEVLEKYK
ncbi:carbohydrate ABC transporter substrate-binding protein (CUT1 family) [Pacificibacter maritimus]|uniref:Carbohydrate ABC transporter substrate-binding protein (CUT1 family) n=1 Tax=Pacificibacter maritimus TaxID=762213 RepID=A0A3N4UM64_9RHOB|nr:ABC transporter substrate-binding protein [Pacificibacter maritimus]RPE71662.1 carbohydrate ABC transporter substrate-binding protein (CUT1 family) [Pacificibacter maritimus]